MNYLHIFVQESIEKRSSRVDSHERLFATRGIRQTETKFGVNKTAHA